MPQCSRALGRAAPLRWMFASLGILLATTPAPAFSQESAALQASGWVEIDHSLPVLEPPGTEVRASTPDSVSLFVTVPGIDVETRYHGDTEFRELSLLGESFTSEVGKPKVPVVRMMLAIPDCESYSLRVGVTDSVQYSEATVWPVPGHAVGYEDEYEYVYEVFALDSASYLDNALYPEGIAVVAEEGSVRDQRYVIVELHPVRYNPARSLLRCYSSISVGIRFENPVETNLRGLGPFEGVCRSVIANYDGIGSWCPRGRGATCDTSVTWCSTVTDCANAGADYLMIVEDSVLDVETIQALADKKSWYDCLNVVVVMVSDITDSTSIAPHMIRDFIRDVYETGTADHVVDGHLGYVLLIGDAREATVEGEQSYELLPAREVYAPHAGYPQSWVPTDHWYACIVDTDYVADLAIGRLAVGDTLELQTEVSKIIGYEPVPLAEEWTNDVLLSCSFAHGDPGWEGHIDGVHSIEIPAIQSILWDESVDTEALHVHEYVVCDSGALPSCAHREYGRPGNRAAVNSGKHIVLLWGHGWECGSLSFINADVDSLSNAAALPFWINISCQTGNFANVSPACDPNDYDCLGEALMHRSNAGAIAFFGATKAIGNHSFGRRILDALYDQSYPMIGEAVAEAKLQQHIDETGDLRSLCAYNLLGEPTLDLFLGSDTGHGGSSDLVVRYRDVSIVPDLANYDDEMTFECRVSNEGPESTSPDTVVVAFDLYHSDGRFSSRLVDRLGAMAAWKADTARVTWTPPGDSVGAYDLRIMVDPYRRIDELNEWNNTPDDTAHFYVYPYADGFPLKLQPHEATAIPVSPVTVCDLGDSVGQKIVVAYLSGYVKTIDQSGAPVWLFDQGITTEGALCPAVADFDWDGVTEVATVVFGSESPSGPRQDALYVLQSETGNIWKNAAVGEVLAAPLAIDVAPVDGRPELAVVGVDDEERGSLSVWDFSTRPPSLSWEKSLGSGSSWQHTSPPTAVNSGLHPADLVTWDYSPDDTLIVSRSATGSLNWRLCAQGLGGHRGFGIAAGGLGQNGDLLLASARASDGLLLVHNSTSPDIVWSAPIPDTSEVVIGNVDSDAELEIVCAGGCTVLVFDQDDSAPVWWAGLKGVARGEPLIGDFDGGDDVEIIVGAQRPDGGGSLVYVLSVPSAPGTLEVALDPVEVRGTYATGALCDLDNDGSNDIVFATNDGVLHRLEYWGASNPRFEWPMYRHDERNSGLYEQPVMGTLTQSTTWSGDMHIMGDVVVPDSLTLNLAAGADIEVLHDYDYLVSGRNDSLCELIVEGTLVARGGPLSRVSFGSDAAPLAQPRDWLGIALEPGSVCSLAFTDVSDAEKSLWAMTPSALDVRDSRFLNQKSMGVHMYGCVAPAVLAGCTVENAAVGVRADSCAVVVQENTLSGISQCGIRLLDDQGSMVEDNEIAVGSGMALTWPRGIFCSNAFDQPDITVCDNTVYVGAAADSFGEGICVYAVPAASPDLSGNELIWEGASTGLSMGIRLTKTPAVARGNSLSGFTHHFYVETEAGQVPDLGDTTDPGNNSADNNALYNVYATAQPPVDPLRAKLDWWGTEYPSGRKFAGYGIGVEWEPCLAEDPSARAGHGVADEATGRYDLAQNHPNPFNPVTLINYAIPQQSRVRIAVYDLSGRLVRMLLDDVMPTGSHAVAWDGRNEKGQPTGSGVYFCRMEAGSFTKSRKVIVLK